MSPQARRSRTSGTRAIPGERGVQTTTSVRRWFAVVLAAFSCAGTQAPIQAQQHDEWLGKRVVQKGAKLTLRINDEPVDSDGKARRIYRIEEVDGASFLIKSESDRSSGWASASDVIAVDQAIDYFTKKIRLEPKGAFPFAMMGLLREDKGEHELAIGNYNEAIRLDSQNAAGFGGRATAWYAKGEFDKAIADFDSALRLDPKNSAAYLGRGLTRTARNQHTLAIADFSEAIWLDPLSITAYENRGQAWQSKREYAKAVIDFNMVLRLDPERAAAYRRRGACWEAEKRYGKAIADLSEAIHIDPGDAMAYRELARLLATCPDLAARDFTRAIASATKSCELTQWKDSAGLDALAAACAAAEDFESAVKWQIKSNALSHSPIEQKEGKARLERYREKRP